MKIDERYIMKKIKIKKSGRGLIALAIAVMMTVIPVVGSAEELSTVSFVSNGETVTLSDTATGSRSAVKADSLNTVTLTFNTSLVEYATLAVVQTDNGADLALEPENIVYAKQANAEGGQVTFSFYLKPETDGGVYALYAGWSGTTRKLGYFDVQVDAEISSVSFESNGQTITLSDTATGSMSAISADAKNTVTVTFNTSAVKYATLVAVRTENDAAMALEPENIVYAKQVNSEGRKAVFEFCLKPGTEAGVYALYAGGSGLTTQTAYFKVENAYLPFDITAGQVYQYDDYKDGIDLRLRVTDATRFEMWATLGSAISINLTQGDKTASISGADVQINADTGIISIPYSKLQSICPQFGESHDGGKCRVDVSISTDGYYADSNMNTEKVGVIKFVIPEISSDGFKSGVDFSFTVTAAEAITGARPIVAVYDRENLVCCAEGETADYYAGETKTVTVRVQSGNISPSSSFRLKAMLWNGSSLIPLVMPVSLK